MVVPAAEQDEVGHHRRPAEPPMPDVVRLEADAGAAAGMAAAAVANEQRDPLAGRHEAVVAADVERLPVGIEQDGAKATAAEQPVEDALGQAGAAGDPAGGPDNGRAGGAGRFT